MRFISHSPGFKIQVMGERVHFSNFGDRIVDREGVIVEFNQNDVTDTDLLYAERLFTTEGLLHGRTVLVDEVTPTPILDRVSVYDTDEEAMRGDWYGRTIVDSRGIEHDKKDYIEQFLSERAVNHPDFRQVAAITPQAPWPSYLTFQGSLDQLLDKIESDGFSLHEVLAFETQVAKRPAVIEAISARIAERAHEAAQEEQVPA